MQTTITTYSSQHKLINHYVYSIDKSWDDLTELDKWFIDLDMRVFETALWLMDTERKIKDVQARRSLHKQRVYPMVF